MQPGKTYPMTISVVDTIGNYVPLQRFDLKIKATGLRVVLTWDKADTDVDLHVQDSKGQHAWYADLTGIPNGNLDNDDTDGFGPEAFTLQPLEPNVTYDVYLHYYSDHDNGPTNAKVIVYLDGEPVTDFSVNLVDDDSETYAIVGTYPAKTDDADPDPMPSPSPSPTPDIRLPPGGGVVAAGHREQRERSRIIRLNRVAPDIVEYSLPSQPGVKLYLHMTPKGVARPNRNRFSGRRIGSQKAKVRSASK